MSGGSGEEWEGMLGLVWEIESYCFVVWWCGAVGPWPPEGGKVVIKLYINLL